MLDVFRNVSDLLYSMRSFFFFFKSPSLVHFVAKSLVSVHRFYTCYVFSNFLVYDLNIFIYILSHLLPRRCHSFLRSKFFAVQVNPVLFVNLRL